MQPIRIVIAQGNSADLRRIGMLLSQQPDLSVAGEATGSEQAEELVLRHRPELLITGLAPDGIDGLRLLKRLGEAQALPQVIVASASTQEELIRQAVELGAACFLAKPWDRDLLLQRIRRLCRPDAPLPAAVPPAPQAAMAAESDLARYVSRVLMTLSIPPHLAGHRFLKQAILLTLEDPTLPERMGDGLYPAVARLFDSTPSRVERAIRFAVSRTWAQGGGAAYCRLLGQGMPLSRPPSNRELIASLAERARLRT